MDPKFGNVVDISALLESNARLAEDKRKLAAKIDAKNEEEETPATKKLIDLATKRFELIHTSDQVSYAVEKDAHDRGCVAVPIRSRAFRLRLAKLFWEESHGSPSDAAVRTALDTIEAFALFDSESCTINLRVAARDGAIYLDLGKRFAKITREGWCIVDDAPVYFRRPSGLLPLPEPMRGGRISELRDLLNLPGKEHDREWILAVSWLMCALRPTGPYPVLFISGEHGAAKSTFTKIVRLIVDPAAADTRREPKEERDLAIAADNAWIVALENVSSFAPWLSDALCSIATGAAFATRSLYTDREEQLFRACRPIAANGIAQIATRPDLLDRGWFVELPTLGAGTRKEETKLWAEVKKAHPQILGALLDATVTALATVDDLKLTNAPRMIDAAKWALAAAPSLGFTREAVEAALLTNEQESIARAVDSNPVASALEKIMAQRPKEPLVKTASDLLDMLNTFASVHTQRQAGWPQGANGLSGQLRRLAPALRDRGIEVTAPTNHRDRLWTIKRA